MTPIDWELAERIAVRVAGREPFAESYHYASLEPDFAELTAEAEELVAQETGLRSLSGPARARVTDRAGWVRANIASFQRLLRPLTDRLDKMIQSRDRSGSIAPNAFGSLTRRATGAELERYGWMSTRVLGQYDMLIVEEEGAHDQDIVYYVGPNVLALEKKFAFPPREFRLWLALHEVTHRAQFTGIPWLRPHFLQLVDKTLDAVDPDPKRFLYALRRLFDGAREGRNPLDDGGLLALLATPEQQEVLHQVSGLMSLLEGHGDVTMDRAGADRIPNAERFSRVLRQRRSNVSPPARLLQRLVGLEAKLNQYEQGERFIAAVESVGGPELLHRAFDGPEALPTLAEIRAPHRWVERIGGLAAPGLSVANGLRLRSAVATILVVDDEPDLRELMQLVLEREHSVVLVTGGAEALDAVNEQTPDLVVLDLMMPDVDGWAVLTELKRHPNPEVRTVPVLMLTAVDELQAQARGGIEGAVRWLTKPFKIEELLAAVRQALDEPESVQRRRAQGRALEQLARLERDGDNATTDDPLERGPRLTALERPHVSPARHRRDAVFGALDRLTETQRRTVEAVAVQSVSDAAIALGVSRSSIYATLRRCARRLGVDSVSELLNAIRPSPRDRANPRRG